MLCYILCGVTLAVSTLVQLWRQNCANVCTIPVTCRHVVGCPSGHAFICLVRGRVGKPPVLTIAIKNSVVPCPDIASDTCGQPAVL